MSRVTTGNTMAPCVIIGERAGQILPGKMFATFIGIFQGKDAPNPHDVPEAIAKLVGQAKGSCPARAVVGEP